MELPAYHAPRASTVLRSMWERGWSFIKRAGTIILVACILVWFLANFGFTNGGFGMVSENADSSLLAALGGLLSWIFIPLGFGTWEATAATVTGLIAKENLVSTFAVIYAVDGMWYANMQAAFGLAAAFSLLAFNLLCAPCFAAIGAIRREMNNARWTAATVAYQCLVAWLVGLWVFQFAGLATGEVAVNPFTFIAAASFIAFLVLLLRPQKKRALEPVTRKKATDAA